MKYLFAREVSENKIELIGAEADFCRAEAPQSLRDDLLREAETVQDTVRRTLPRWLSITRTVSMIIASILLISSVRALSNVTPAQAYHNAPYFFWIGGAAGLIYLACRIYERVQTKRLTEDEPLGREYERAAENIKTYLDIPHDTETVDVLSFRYVPRDDGLSFQGAASNESVELWREKDSLCVFDGVGVYALPLDSASIRVLSLGVPMDGDWNKNEPPESKRFQKAGVRTVYAVENELRFCCALDLSCGGERFRLLFPAYELPVFSALTGLAAPKLPKKWARGEKSGMEAADDFALSAGPVRPKYYWRLPKEEAGFWFSPASDVEFKAAHPVIYTVLVLISIVVLLAPGLIFAFSALRVPGNENNAWIFLGVVGGFVTGVGLFNLVAAWMQQYLGHIFTLICLLAGSGLMAATWFFLL